jgi:SPP1 gp7 family putative phage head morphogenesis protein
MTENEKAAAKAVAKLRLGYERELQQIYIDQLKEIRAIMSMVYEKYAEDGILTKAEMTRYNRLATLESQLIKLAGDSAKASTRLIQRMQPEVYQEAFFRYAWALDMDNQIRLSYGLINPAAIKASLINDMEKIAIERYAANAKLRIRQALQNGLIQGQGYVAMATDIKTAINATAFEALRIMRTEGQTAQNAGAEDVYDQAREQGVKGQEIWVATLDDRTRDSHGDMDGVAKEDDGLFHIPASDKTDAETTPYPGWEGLSAGNRINCRCTTRFEVEGYEPQVRRVRGEGVIKYQTYTEWKAGQRR